MAHTQAFGGAMTYIKYLVAFIAVTALLILLFRPSGPIHNPLMNDHEYLAHATWAPNHLAFNRTNAPKRILVTGGSGFVGSHLVDRLMLEGHTVVVLDNFYTSSPENVQHWDGHPRFTLVKHDVINPYSDTGFHQIYHLASPASPPQYQKDPIYTTKTNVWGTLNMLELALANNARFLLASTSEVYGDPLVHPQVESDWGHVNPIGPRACYDEAKRLAETLTFDFHRTKGSDIRVVRIFNTYGPRMTVEDGRVVSNFIVQALHGNPLTVYGQGKQTRSFGYVSDLVDGLIRLMNTEDITGPINIGNPTENTVHELAKIITEILGGELKVSNKPLPTNDPQRRKPDITLAQTLLGWSPKVPLSQGLQETIKFFKKVEGL
jgi:UDP-glucuronate decarboxylase